MLRRPFGSVRGRKLTIFVALQRKRRGTVATGSRRAGVPSGRRSARPSRQARPSRPAGAACRSGPAYGNRAARSASATSRRTRLRLGGAFRCGRNWRAAPVAEPGRPMPLHGRNNQACQSWRLGRLADLGDDARPIPADVDRHGVAAANPDSRPGRRKARHAASARPRNRPWDLRRRAPGRPRPLLPARADRPVARRCPRRRRPRR